MTPVLFSSKKNAQTTAKLIGGGKVVRMQKGWAILLPNKEWYSMEYRPAGRRDCNHV